MRLRGAPLEAALQAEVCQAPKGQLPSPNHAHRAPSHCRDRQRAGAAEIFLCKMQEKLQRKLAGGPLAWEHKGGDTQCRMGRRDAGGRELNTCRKTSQLQPCWMRVHLVRDGESPQCSMPEHLPNQP